MPRQYIHDDAPALLHAPTPSFLQINVIANTANDYDGDDDDHGNDNDDSDYDDDDASSKTNGSRSESICPVSKEIAPGLKTAGLVLKAIVPVLK